MFLSNFPLLSHVVNFLYIQFVTNNIKIVIIRPKRLHDKRIFILGRCWKVALCFEEKRLWNSCFHKLSHLVHWKLSSFSPSVFWFKVLFSFPKTPGTRWLRTSWNSPLTYHGHFVHVYLVTFSSEKFYAWCFSWTYFCIDIDICLLVFYYI